MDEKSTARMAARVKELSEPGLDDAELRDDATGNLVAVARRKRERGEDVVEVAGEASEAAPEGERGGARVVDLMALLKERMREGRAARRESPGGKETAHGAREAKHVAGTGAGSRSSARAPSAARRSPAGARARSRKGRRAG